MKSRFFASDNCSSVHPSIMNALSQINRDHVLGYGEDEFSIKAAEKIKEQFSVQSEIFFVYNGTAANVLALSAACRQYEGVLAAKTAHINHHETGALEHFNGIKILYAEGDQGKISVDSIKEYLHEIGDEHVIQPKIISISQPTELGTVYSKEEVSIITEFAHRNNMIVHMDGARLFNAASALKSPISEITCDLGVDFLSFGGTKNGLMFGEIVVFFHHKHNTWFNEFKYIRKQGMQLHSKMRYLSIQYLYYFDENLCYSLARHANEKAGYLAGKLEKYCRFPITVPLQTNQIFVRFPNQIIDGIQKESPFYVWEKGEQTSIVRLVCSWDSEDKDIDEFVDRIITLL